MYLVTFLMWKRAPTKILIENIRFNGKMLKAFLLGLGQRQGCLLSTTSIQLVQECLKNVVIEEQEIKGITMGKEKNKNMIIYR